MKKRRNNQHLPRAKTHMRKKGKGSPSRAAKGKENAVCGVFCGTRRGFAFVTPDEGGEDIFIPAHATGGAFDGDRVRVLARPHYDRGIEGRVDAVLEKRAATVIGTLYSERVRGSRARRRAYFIAPDNSRMPASLPLAEAPEASEGDKIECRIERGRFPYAVFLRSFGPAASRRANYESVLAENAITVDFEESALREAASRAAMPLSREGRHVEKGPILTIDGADAKDLDDAVSLRKTDKGYLLSVHIADVSEYVTPKTALDRAAMHRGTSVYFVDRVVPMLPPALSNGACSLNAGEEKYTLSAHISLSKNGKILETRLERGIIRSDVRGVYSEVNDIFEKGEVSEYAEKYRTVYKMLFLMRELYEILAENAAKRGYLDFDAPEPHFVLNEKGDPIDIIRRTRGVAERLIEQFMLTANEGVATLLFEKKYPCVYRIHDEPPADKLEGFKRYVSSLGLDPLPLTGEPLSTLAFAAVLGEAAEKDKAAAISIPMVRTMAKASYSDLSRPHFGLGLTHYCHFTSPIRRLSDLATHRMIKAVLLDGQPPEKYASYARRAAVAASESELRALNAERQINALYAALWADGHIGEEFEASISGLTAFGMFAALDNSAEGLVPIEELPFGAVYDESAGCLRMGSEVYRMADRVRVCIAGAEIAARRIRFSFLGKTEADETH